MALLLALAVNVGVGTMVETFSRTFVIWLDGRLAADVYINAHDNAQAEEIKAWLRQRPEVQAILPGGRADTEIEGAPVEIARPARSRHLSRSLAVAAIRRQRLDPPSSRRCRLHQRAIGAALETRASATASNVPAPGGNWTLEVVGIYADYGNPKGQVAVNFAALTRHFPAIPQTRLGLRVAPAAVPALIAALQDKFGLDGRNCWIRPR